jgi:hypothetical protein
MFVIVKNGATAVLTWSQKENPYEPPMENVS